MKRIFIRAVKPSKMSEEQKTEYVEFHQHYLLLDEKAILDYVSPRDVVLMYYDKVSKKLVATVGVQVIHFKKESLIYFGNVVVDPDYKHAGCISHASAKYVLRLFLFHPMKQKYCCGLASSSGALEYSLKHRPAWPNPDETTPPEITQLILRTLDKLNMDRYRIEHGNVIVNNLSDKINGKFHLREQPKSAADSFFHAINPGAEKGEQIFFLNPFTLRNAVDLAVHGLHSQLIKSPKLYHKIIKYKTEKPFFTILLLALAVFRIKF
ncbi:hypothetical protein [Legionella waltersii]|uniref:N-acetyltransferase domain-containing protein n=1 Tax=Legionella waltersii TaxID=66969 RepID=A0A0W1A4W5_9GAMM|nr:hypothetical protein [Legionella waltersii]KTD76313.1 hypothetical protein Lwal_2035 [Legionella waltersii]SNV13641.1 Uncharacterised protein [Legionella waltersii]